MYPHSEKCMTLLPLIIIMIILVDKGEVSTNSFVIFVLTFELLSSNLVFDKPIGKILPVKC